MAATSVAMSVPSQNMTPTTPVSVQCSMSTPTTVSTTLTVVSSHQAHQQAQAQHHQQAQAQQQQSQQQSQQQPQQQQQQPQQATPVSVSASAAPHTQPVAQQAVQNIQQSSIPQVDGVRMSSQVSPVTSHYYTDGSRIFSSSGELVNQVQVIQQPLHNPTYLQQLYTPQQQMLLPGNLTIQSAGMAPTLQSIGAPGLSLQLQGKAVEHKSGGATLIPASSMQGVSHAAKGVTISSHNLVAATGQMITAGGKTCMSAPMLTAAAKSTVLQGQSGFVPSTTNQAVVIGQLLTSQPSILPTHTKTFVDSHKGKPFVMGHPASAPTKPPSFPLCKPAALQPKSPILPSPASSGATTAQVLTSTQLKHLTSTPQLITSQAPATMMTNQPQILGSLQAIGASLPQGITWATPSGLQSSALVTQNPIFIRSQQPDMFIQSPQATLHAVSMAPPPAPTPVPPPQNQLPKQKQVRPASSVATQTAVSTSVTVNSHVPPVRSQVKQRSRGQGTRNSPGPGGNTGQQHQAAQTATTQTQTQPSTAPQQQLKADAANQTRTTPEVRSTATQSKATATETKQLLPILPQPPTHQHHHQQQQHQQTPQLHHITPSHPPQHAIQQQQQQQQQQLQQMQMQQQQQVLHQQHSPQQEHVQQQLHQQQQQIQQHQQYFQQQTMTQTLPVASKPSEVTHPVPSANVAPQKMGVLVSSTTNVANAAIPTPCPTNEGDKMDVDQEPVLASSPPPMHEESHPEAVPEKKDVATGEEEERAVPPVEPVKEKQPQKAIVKPHVLTHVIDGFIIQEGPEPFPVSRSALLTDTSPPKPSPPVEKTPEVENISRTSKGKVKKKKLGMKRKGWRKSQTGRLSYNASEWQPNTDVAPMPEQVHTEPEPESDASAKVGHVGEVEAEGETTDTPSGPESSMSPTTPSSHREEMEVDVPEPAVPAYTTKSPSKWTVLDVVDFIRGLPGCADYADEFRSQEIDGQALLLLKEDHLMTAMSMKLGPALKICAKINSMKDEVGR